MDNYKESSHTALMNGGGKQHTHKEINTDPAAPWPKVPSLKFIFDPWLACLIYQFVRGYYLQIATRKLKVSLADQSNRLSTRSQYCMTNKYSFKHLYVTALSHLTLRERQKFIYLLQVQWENPGKNPLSVLVKTLLISNLLSKVLK